MDSQRFDELVRAMGVGGARRGMLIGLCSGLIAPAVSAGGAAAKER